MSEIPEQKNDSDDIEQKNDSEAEQSNDNKAEQSNDSEAEQKVSEKGEKEEIREITFANTVAKVQEMVEKDEKVPENLLWAMSHIDISKIKTVKEETEQDKFEKFYQERKDKEDYGNVINGLKEAYDDEEFSKIEAQVDDLVEKYKMPKMEAFDLIAKGLEPSKKEQVLERRKNQTLPSRQDVSSSNNTKDYKKVSGSFKNSTGIEVSKEEFEGAKKAGVI